MGNKTKSVDYTAERMIELNREASRRGRFLAHHRGLQSTLSSLKASGRIVNRIFQEGNPLTAQDLYSLKAAASQAGEASRELERLVGSLERDFSSGYQSTSSKNKEKK